MSSTNTPITFSAPSFIGSLNHSPCKFNLHFPPISQHCLENRDFVRDSSFPLSRRVQLSMVTSPSRKGTYSQTPSSNTTKKRRHPRANHADNNTNRSSRNASQRNKQKQQQSPPKAPKTQQKIQSTPIEECKTMGEAIQNAVTVSDYLMIVDKFVWLPSDENLPPHLRTQAIHHEKRRRWGSQLLEGLGQAALGLWENENDLLLEKEREHERDRTSFVWRDERLVRAILSVALPMDGDGPIDRPEKEGSWIAAALKGLHVLSGCISPIGPSPAFMSPLEVETWMNLHRGISMLIKSADSLLSDHSTLLKDTVEVRWAIRGVVARLQIANISVALPNTLDIDSTMDENSIDVIGFTTPNLNSRTSKLPFDILHHCLPWQIDSSKSNYYGYPTQNLLPNLLRSIPYNFDTLTTRTGNSVIERRGTAWLAEDGIGALAYSGKLMSPAEVPDIVREAMREVEQWCGLQGQTTWEEGQKSSQIVDISTIEDSNELSNKRWAEFVWEDYTSFNLAFEELGQFLLPSPSPNSDQLSSFFDCALCNHYPDGDSACKFHTDPEHGSHWHRTTAVVSCGTSRKFAFRPIPEVSIWSEWDNQTNQSKQTASGEGQHQSKDDTACAPAVLQLFPGDVVFMAGVCNDVFHHAVYASPFDGGGSSRVSLVFKRALDRGGGKKGHSLAGEGRRSRRKNNMDF